MDVEYDNNMEDEWKPKVNDNPKTYKGIQIGKVNDGMNRKNIVAAPAVAGTLCSAASGNRIACEMSRIAY